MKTLELKLKKEMLIVDAEGLEITQALIFNKFGNYNLSCYDFLGKGSELTEEILINFIDVKRISSSEGEIFPDFKNKGWLFGKPNRYRSFISAVESIGFYWLENPIKIIERGEDTEHNRVLNQNKWQEAEAKTFKNPLIFVKN